jgi:uncharacterized protein (DUF849 family)
MDSPAPLVIQRAITGSTDPDPQQRPIIPLTLAAIIGEALATWRAGAVVIHLHAREADGTPTQAHEDFRCATIACDRWPCRRRLSGSAAR